MNSPKDCPPGTFHSMHVLKSVLPRHTHIHMTHTCILFKMTHPSEDILTQSVWSWEIHIFNKLPGNNNMNIKGFELLDLSYWVGSVGHLYWVICEILLTSWWPKLQNKIQSQKSLDLGKFSYPVEFGKFNGNDFYSWRVSKPFLKLLKNTYIITFNPMVSIRAYPTRDRQNDTVLWSSHSQPFYLCLPLQSRKAENRKENIKVTISTLPFPMSYIFFTFSFKWSQVWNLLSKWAMEYQSEKSFWSTIWV